MTRELIRIAPDGRLYRAPRKSMPNPPRYHAPKPDPQHVSDDASDRKQALKRGYRRLTDDEVREIRADYATGRWEISDLAYIYGFSCGRINSAIHGYRHVVGED